MQVLFIYFSVIMLRDVMNTVAEEITDLSDWCKRGRVIDFYLTSGAGPSDARVLMIASEEPLNCTLLVKVKPKNFIMLVVEYPDKTPEEKVCYSQSNRYVLLRDYDTTHHCREHGNKTIYYGSSQNSMLVSVSSRGLMNTVKITLTSMRDSSVLKCSELDEITCVYESKVYCMSTSILCDSNINCGPEYDEDEHKCKEVKMTFLMIICTFLTSTMSFTLIACAAFSVIPTRKEIFIHAYDQSLNLFDSDAVISSEIQIVELLPLDSD